MKMPAAMALLEHVAATRRVARVIRALRLRWLVAFGNWILDKLRSHLAHFVKKAPGPRVWP